MELSTIFLVLGALFGVSSLVALGTLQAYSSRRKNKVKELVTGVLAGSSSDNLGEARRTTRILDSEEIKRVSREATRSKLQVTEVLDRAALDNAPYINFTPADAKFFQAGLYTNADKRAFKKFQIISPIICFVLGLALLNAIGAEGLLLLVGGILGLFIGVVLPRSWLDRQIEYRRQESMRYLPLSIEQISIGVSSSLDLWPCIAHIIEMSRQRDTFNPITELLIHVEKMIISGLSFQDALVEVGYASGVVQVKHCFQFLAQCAEHGGEISKQLQELANSVMIERQSDVEAKISSLPVKATGPLFMVFAGYFALMLAGIFSRLVTSLKF